MKKEITSASTIDRKEFMKLVGISFGAIMLMNCLQGCSDGELPDPIAPVNSGKVDVTLNLNQTAYSKLNTPGGFVVLNDLKIIVARTSDLANPFVAVQSNCTHEGTTIQYFGNERVFACPNHGAVFQENGAVAKGPATTPLKLYKDSFDATANSLRIFE